MSSRRFLRGRLKIIQIAPLTPVFAKNGTSETTFESVLAAQGAILDRQLGF
jgi:hypothetical protein